MKSTAKIDLVVPVAAYHRDRFRAALPNWREVAQLGCVGQVIVVCDGFALPEEPGEGIVVRAIARPPGDDGFRPNAARTLGTLDVSAEIVMYVDGDVIVSGDTVRGHLQRHTESETPRLVAGLHRNIVTPEGSVDPYANSQMDEWRYPDVWRGLTDDWREALLDAAGWDVRQLGIPLWSMGAGSNMSVPAEWLLAAGGWNLAFSGWGYDDAEMWYRLAKTGPQIEFAPLYAYHQHHQVDKDVRIRQSRANSNVMSDVTTRCNVTYLVTAAQAPGLSDLVEQSGYRAEAVGAHPLYFSSPLGVRSVPAAPGAEAEAFRPYARGWYLADLRECPALPRPGDWKSIPVQGNQVVTTNGVEYRPASAVARGVHRIIGG